MSIESIDDFLVRFGTFGCQGRMYLIYVKEDNSLTPVENNFVICDHKHTKVEDKVKFVYGNKIFEGVVKVISGRSQQICFQLKIALIIFLCIFLYTEEQGEIDKHLTEFRKKKPSSEKTPQVKRQTEKMKSPEVEEQADKITRFSRSKRSRKQSPNQSLAKKIKTMPKSDFNAKKRLVLNNIFQK